MKINTIIEGLIIGRKLNNLILVDPGIVPKEFI